MGQWKMIKFRWWSGSLIQIRIAILVRCALAEVCTVPVLLVIKLIIPSHIIKTMHQSSISTISMSRKSNSSKTQNDNIFLAQIQGYNGPTAHSTLTQWLWKSVMTTSRPDGVTAQKCGPARCRGSPEPRDPNLWMIRPFDWKTYTALPRLSTTMIRPFASQQTPLGPSSLPVPILNSTAYT